MCFFSAITLGVLQDAATQQMGSCCSAGMARSGSKLPWFRDPPQAAVQTEINTRLPAHLGAEFRNVGECPSRVSEKRMFEETIVETRTRRDSEKCIVQLTGAVTLLGRALLHQASPVRDCIRSCRNLLPHR